MKFPKPYTLSKIAEIVACKYKGAPDHAITGINEIHVVENGDIVFVDHPKYYEKALNCAATTIIINKEVEAPVGKALLLSDDPFSTFNQITQHFSPKQVWHKQTDNKIDPSALIAPTVVMGHNIKIGARVVIHPNVVIYDNATIAADVEIHSNTVIGSHAFYYKKTNGKYIKMHSCGEVIIENNVEIGSGCTIDKGVSGSTSIGEGTKIDNSVHIGHDTVIGKNCLIAAQTGVAGCVIIEDNVTIWGQVGVRSDVTIGEGAIVHAQSGISKSLERGKTYFGSPASESRDKLKELANTRKIPGIINDIREINKRLDES